MKPLYKKLFLLLPLVILFLIGKNAEAQPLPGCPFSYTPGSTAYDTTIATPSGINTLQIKFPKADPLAGMVTCMRLCVSITGVVDSISVENNSTSSQTATVNYIRSDQITGPGLATPLNNNINYTYPPFALAGTDGVAGSGPDFASISKDTLLNAVNSCVNITDAATLFQFYGANDSVTYNYNITAFTIVSCTGGNYNSSISTSAIVRFRLSYCTCPGYTLPLSIKNLFVKKIANNQAEINWSGFEDKENPNYHYEVEMSRDGETFSSLSSLPKDNTNQQSYKYIYTTTSSESGAFFFRIKQVYLSGYSRFSEVKQIYLENSLQPKFSVFPNPSSGIVGIKFDNIESGTMVLQVFDSRGQKIMQKNILVSGSSYQQVGSLESGVYWLRVSDEKNRYSFVNQLLIK